MVSMFRQNIDIFDANIFLKLIFDCSILVRAEMYESIQQDFFGGFAHRIDRSERAGNQRRGDAITGQIAPAVPGKRHPAQTRGRNSVPSTHQSDAWPCDLYQ